MSHYPWNTLGIEETRDQSAIRKAYSAKLKTMNLDEQIQEYAQLRDARDYALSLVRRPEPEPRDDGEPLSADHVTKTPVFNLPDAGADYDDYEDFDDYDDFYVGGPARFEGGYGPAYHHGPALSEGWEDPGQEQAADQEQIDAWRTLEKVVFPDGQQSDDAMDAEEFASAEAALQVLLDRAVNGNITQSNAIDFNLAEIMASGWPRSAPLVEPANQEFHWLGDAGQLIERPALQFLNARIAGMRFNEEVLKPSHTYHKAWNDLAGGDTTPVFLKRWWLKRERVFELLGVIRGNYPELEYLLDGDRIHKWENSTSSSFARIIQWIAIIYFGLTALSFCADRDEKSTEDVLSSDVTAEVVPKVTEDLFGVGWGRDQLAEKDAEFAEKLVNTSLLGYFDTEEPSVEGSIDRGRDLVRRQMLAARDTAEFDDLLLIQQAYMGWLIAAQKIGPDACTKALSWEDLTPGDTRRELSGKALAREQALATDLLEKGLLSQDTASAGRSANVPGWVIGEVIDNSRYSDAQVRDALGNQDSPDRCGVMIELMKAVAKAPGRVDAALLRFP